MGSWSGWARVRVAGWSSPVPPAPRRPAARGRSRQLARRARRRPAARRAARSRAARSRPGAEAAGSAVLRARRRPAARRARRPASAAREPAGPGPGPAGVRAAADGVPVIALRRSSRSSRAWTPCVVWSAPGSSTRAQISSSSSRGAVAPRISVSPVATRSAARLRSARPKRADCATRRSPWSSETSIRPVAGASGTAATITRSRRRRSRSSVKRRGSWPVSITLSTTPKTDPPSPAAKASTTSSSRVSGV